MLKMIKPTTILVLISICKSFLTPLIVSGFNQPLSTTISTSRYRSPIITSSRTATRITTERGRILTVSTCSSSTSLRQSKDGSNFDEDSSSPLRFSNDIVTGNIQRTIIFSILMTMCGAILGPFLDAYHSAFGVLQYDEPITATLWGKGAENPALITAWWVPELFGLAGFIIGWLYILLDAVDFGPAESSNGSAISPKESSNNNRKRPSPPKILVGISLFTFQYWLSGILYSSGVVDRTEIFGIMSVFATTGFLLLDRTVAGFITSSATAIGGPLIEVMLISVFRANILSGGYHYTDSGETGFFPLWIVPVYFLGGPAVGNLARGFWNALGEEESSSVPRDPCLECNDTRRADCPNCEGIGTYVAMGGQSVECSSCKGRGYVICRSCFSSYNEDPYDIEAIRELMSKMPD